MTRLRPRRNARGRERITTSLPARLWPFEPKYRKHIEVQTVLNFTREGLFFRSGRPHYYLGMRVLVRFPYCAQARASREYLGEVVRLEEFTDGSQGIALQFVF